MVTVKLFDLLSAYEFASSGEPFESSAFLHLDSGEFFYTSNMLSLDDEAPEDLDTSDRYLALPHKRDLDLGQTLIFSFIEEYLPKDYDSVSAFFNRRGAYRRFRDLLEQRGKLDGWYAFEAQATEQALRLWCKDHQIRLAD